MGMFGTFAAATVAVYYKPDTRCAPPQAYVWSLFRLTRLVRFQYTNMGPRRSQETDGGSRRGHRLRPQTLESPHTRYYRYQCIHCPPLGPNLKHIHLYDQP